MLLGVPPFTLLFGCIRLHLSSLKVVGRSKCIRTNGIVRLVTSTILCAGDYNHALELDTRKNGLHVHSSRRFNSAQNSPTRADRKAGAVGSDQDVTQPGCNVHNSQSSQDDLIKATHGISQAPSDSFLRASRSGSIESHGSQLAPDRGCETEAAIEVLKPDNSSQSADVTAVSRSHQGHAGSRSVAPKDEDNAQMVAQYLASGYSNRKKVIPILIFVQSVMQFTIRFQTMLQCMWSHTFVCDT